MTNSAGFPESEREPRLALLRGAGTLLPAILVITALAIGGIAILVASHLADSVRSQAIDDAAHTGQVFVDAVVGPPDEFSRGRLTREGISEFSSRVAGSGGITGARLWGRDLRLRYASKGFGRIDGHGHGHGHGHGPEGIVGALHGRVTAKVTRAPATVMEDPGLKGGDELLEVHLPVRSRQSKRPGYALELFMPYRPVQASINVRTRRLLWILGVAGLAFYLALLPLLLRTSRKLSRLRGGAPPGLARRVRRAIHDGHIVTYYQPIIDLTSDRPVGAEALVRWAHPKRGLLTPDQFVPHLAGHAVLHDLTLHVLDAALAAQRGWHEAGHELSVSVNVPEESLSAVEFCGEVDRLLRRHGVPPESLVLEITEEAVMREPTATTEGVEALRLLGVRLAMDDFGTGHSSLARLARMPFDELKIDRSFLWGIDSNEGDFLSVWLITELSKRLGNRVVAEGVETDLQHVTVRELGCDLAQGYRYSKPIPDEEFRLWLHARQARHHRDLVTSGS